MRIKPDDNKAHRLFNLARELYAAILPNKTQCATKEFLAQVLDECPYTIEQYYTLFFPELPDLHVCTFLYRA